VIKTCQAGEKDLIFLADVFLRAMRPYITAARGCWDEARERVQFLDQLRVNHTKIIEQDGARAGFFMIVSCDSDREIHTLCIAPEHQRRGLGTAVMQGILDDAREHHRDIVLSVLKVNVKAQSFYKRLGFTVVEESSSHYRMRRVS
jgi:ribosomal protein S18 acetylase RimI-like enzyme